MCLAVPMQITAIAGFDARCAARGVERDVSMFMLQGENVGPGDWVLVHVGYAIQVVSPEEARETWGLLAEILAGEEEARSA